MPALGVRLTVLAGPTIPVPLPAPDAARLRSATVTETDEERSAFTLTFDAGRSGPQAAFDSPMMQSPVAANARVVLVVTFGAMPVVLMDGVVTEVELAPGEEPGAATLTATGEDVSVLLDREERDREHPAQGDYQQVLAILAPYKADGIVPDVRQPSDMQAPLPTERVPTQHQTDLRHLVTLAKWHGFVAYVLPGPAPGISTFYWGPPIREGTPQRALSVDLGPDTNVISPPRFRQNALGPVEVEGSVQDGEGAKVPVRPAASSRLPLAARPLSSVHAGRVRKRRLRDSGFSPESARARAQAEVDRSIDAVVGEGELDGSRYGDILRPRGLVGVRGAGWSHDGLWYVRQVAHELAPGSYRQRFTLVRDGYGSTVMAVRV